MSLSYLDRPTDNNRNFLTSSTTIVAALLLLICGEAITIVAMAGCLPILIWAALVLAYVRNASY